MPPRSHTEPERTPQLSIPLSQPSLLPGVGKDRSLCCSNSGIIFTPPPSQLQSSLPQPYLWGGQEWGLREKRTQPPPPPAACLLPHEPCSICRLCRATERRPTREVQPHSHPQGLPLPLAGVHQLPGLPEPWQKSHPQPFPVSKFQQVRWWGGQLGETLLGCAGACPNTAVAAFPEPVHVPSSIEHLHVD